MRDFDINRLYGNWHEIARLSTLFEPSLKNVTTQYTERSDGGINVYHRGFDSKERRHEAAAKAYFTSHRNIGSFALTYWPPFYTGYFVMAAEVEAEYQYWSQQDSISMPFGKDMSAEDLPVERLVTGPQTLPEMSRSAADDMGKGDLEKGAAAPYSYAMICGKNHSFLWLLSREPIFRDEGLWGRFLQLARKSGFKVENLEMNVQEGVLESL